MQFYKQRDFGELLADTFDFAKIYGKNYFKNFIIINGLIVIILLVVAYFGFGDLFGQLFGSNLNGQSFYFEDYFQENPVVLALSFLLFFAIYVLLSLVSYSYPIFYMKRISVAPDTEITVNDIVSDIKANVGKLLKFFFGVMIIIMPIVGILFVITIFLAFLIIGFFLMILLMPAVLNIINVAFYHYLHTDDGFLNSIGYGIRAQFSDKFWKYWGSVTILYIIIQIVTSIFSIIPVIAELTDSLVISPEISSSNASDILVMVIYGISFVISFILSNLLYINSGFIYYDSREDLHRDVQLSEIQNIGSGGV